MDFSLCLSFCCQYITFSRWLSVPAADKKSNGKEDPAMNACTWTKTWVTLFRLEFPTNYSRLQTEKVQNELEGEGLEDYVCSVRFFLVRTLANCDISTKNPILFSFVDALLNVLLSPLTSPFVHRALSYIAVVFIVIVRLSTRYPAAFQLCHSQRNTSSFLSPISPLVF